MTGVAAPFRKATLQEVSLAAGVSTATVSRFLNDRDSVSDKTQARVQAAIDRLGYVSNGLARALASRRSMTMGVMVPSLSSQVAARTLDAFRARLYTANYGVLLSSYSHERDAAVDATRRLLEREVDGLLVIGGGTHPDMLELVERHGKPFVVTWKPPGPDGPPFICYDHAAASALMARHLLDLGHRRFGFLTGDARYNLRFAERLDAARAPIEAAGAAIAPHHVGVAAQTDWVEGRRAAAAILDAPGPRPTAIIAVNDILAAAGIVECQSRGIRVPEDVSIGGNGDSDLAQSFEPSITTVTVPKEVIGWEAADYLIRSLAGGVPGPSRLLDIGLAVRASTAPPPVASARTP